jgi:hypothetical protein
LKMTNKESKAGAGAAPEEREIITPDTILKRFKLYNDIVSKLRQQNLENGLDAEEQCFCPTNQVKTTRDIREIHSADYERQDW